MKNPWKVLGMEPAASTAELVRKRYHSLARQYHPDLGGDADQFRKLTQAYKLALSQLGSQTHSKRTKPTEATQYIAIAHIDLKDHILGCARFVNLNLPDDQNFRVNVQIPRGRVSGNWVSYDPDVPNLNVELSLRIKLDLPNYLTLDYKNNIVMTHQISIKQLLLGGTISVANPCRVNNEPQTLALKSKPFVRSIRVKNHGGWDRVYECRRDLIIKLVPPNFRKILTKLSVFKQPTKQQSIHQEEK